MSIYSTPFPFYTSRQWNYSVQVNYTRNKTVFTMQFPFEILNTASLPQTKHILQKIAPQVLNTSCINNKNVPFSEEVKKTEIAHLFEHILLEYLCRERIKYGRKTASFSGWTSWNWKKEKKGIFHVEIMGNSIDEHVFMSAFSHSIFLFESILSHHPNVHMVKKTAEGLSSPKLLN